MKAAVRLLASITLLAVLAAPALAAKKVALVIGNGAYPEAPLKNPPNDARAIAATLKRQGFEVLLKENASKAQMNDIVADFGEKLAEGDTALFFFAGHGMQVQGRNYLIPTDARITSEQRVRLETLDVEAVLDQMAAARARVSMVILDACRNNPFERRFRSIGGGLAQINAPEGTMIAYATSPGKVAADGDGSNGLYTQELLKALGQPGLKVEDVFKHVRIGVARASNGLQVPWEASSLTGDFYFNPPPPASAANVPAAMPVDREAIFWDSIKASTDPAEFRAYLDAFPTGTFSPLARMRLANLEAARQPQVASRTPTPIPAAPAAPPPAAVTAPAGDIGGQFMTRLPTGILQQGNITAYIVVENGTVRYSSNYGSQVRGVDGRCFGSGPVDGKGRFENLMIACVGGTMSPTTMNISGSVVRADGAPQVQAVMTNAKSENTEVMFK